jgi:hypothetical protein
MRSIIRAHIEHASCVVRARRGNHAIHDAHGISGLREITQDAGVAQEKPSTSTGAQAGANPAPERLTPVMHGSTILFIGS